MGQRAGELVHPARPEALLRRLRVGGSRLRRPGVARRAVRRRAAVPGPLHRRRTWSRSRRRSCIADRRRRPHDGAKEGTGRLYYRVGLRTAPASLELDPSTAASSSPARYEAVDDPADVTRDADGTWHIRAGARVRVRLTMVAESQRTHVALVDPLPAGLEILNPTLATTARGAGGSEATHRRAVRHLVVAPPWFDHQNLRDDRAEAFATFPPRRRPTTTATSPSRRRPARSCHRRPTAEEIYAPETFGRAATDRVVVA